MSSADAAATTAAKGDIADPAKLKEANAAAEAETKDSEAPKNGSNGTSGDATNGTNGDSAKAADEEPVAGSSKSPSKKDLDVVTQAMGYYAAGKRDLLIRDPASAVASLAQACELLGKHYGETAFECGEPLYYYGRALLDLARMEAGVIDNVMDGVPSEDESANDDSMVGDPEKCTEEEKEKIGKEVDGAIMEMTETCDKKMSEKEAKEKAATDATNGKAEDKADGNCVSSESNGKSSPASKDKEMASPKNGKTSPKADKEMTDSKTSPKADKETNGKTSPKSDKEINGKTSPKSDKETNGKSSPKATAASPKKEVKTTPDGKTASPKVKDEEMEVEVASGKDTESPKTGSGKKLDPTGVANGKKESEEDSKDGDSQDGEEEEDKENGEEEEEAADGEDGKDDSIQGDGAEKEDVAATEKEDEEEPSNLQLAWEMLELAKNILMKQSESLKDTDKDKKSLVDSRICDTYQTLGEVSIENENYQQAIDDLETCLKRRKDMLPEDSRVIAETQYQLGVAQGFNSDFDRAVESLDEAISVLQKRVENLKAEKESKDPAKAKDAFYTREGEIKEIESLIPEIKEKIADTKDMKSEFAKKLAEARLTLTGGSQEEVAGKSDSSVSTISTNLIKKRKKSGEEDGSGDSADAKKAKADSAEASSTNGTAKEESAK